MTSYTVTLCEAGKGETQTYTVQAASIGEAISTAKAHAREDGWVKPIVLRCRCKESV